MRKTDSIEVFVFPSLTSKNIEIGVRERIWAVDKPKNLKSIRRYATKALKMDVGDYGIFYDVQRKGLTVPFIVAGQVDRERTITDIWNGNYFLPFKIAPLGRIYEYLSKMYIVDYLPSLRYADVKPTAWHRHILIQNHQFDPSILQHRDWQALIRLLC